MHISFRQGLVQVPPTFLQLSAGKVSLVLAESETVVATLAVGASNYLHVESKPIADAWIGPFAPGVDYWLYVDINMLTGVRTFAHTLLEPIVAATPPASPATDQHWYDTSVMQTKTWNGFKWIPKLRVFFSKLYQGSVFVSVSANSPRFTGTQVGVNQPIDAGTIVYDTLNMPIKQSDGTFFTTENVALAGTLSSSRVKLASVVVQAESTQNIAAYSIVRFVEFNKIAPATDYLIDNSVYGIIELDVTPGDIVQVSTEGMVTNPGWDWSNAGVNTILYVDSIGTLTTTPPPTPIPVAVVINPTTILMRPSSLFTNTSNDPATTTNLGAVLISVDADVADQPIAVGTNDPRIEAVFPHIADSSVHVTSQESQLLSDMLDGVISVTTTTTDAGQILDLVPTTKYRALKYVIQVTSNGTFQATEILVLQDGVSAYSTEYATLLSGAELAQFSCDIAGGNVELTVTPQYPNAMFKLVRTGVSV